MTTQGCRWEKTEQMPAQQKQQRQLEQGPEVGERASHRPGQTWPAFHACLHKQGAAIVRTGATGEQPCV